MNTRTIPPINLQVGQRVLRRDGVPGTVTAFDHELFRIIWDNATSYHYEENGKWCASWGADRHDFDVRAVEDPGYVASSEVPTADKLGTAIISAVLFVFGFILGSSLGIIYSAASIN